MENKNDLYGVWGENSFRIKRLKECYNHAAICEPFLDPGWIKQEQLWKTFTGQLGKFGYGLGISWSKGIFFSPWCDDCIEVILENFLIF